MIEIAPLEQGRGQWKIAAADEVTVTVTAPGAERIQILGRPEGVEEEYLELRTLAAPVDHAGGRFVTRLNLAPDFAGSVWAEASYSDGAKRRSETIALTTDSKIKIPLGSGYMIHEATKADDIGRAVSHGSILMLKADLLDLAEKIITARNLPVTKSRIAQLGDSHERLAQPLDPPLLVDINYDLQVVEGGALHVYPDVYDRGAFALDSLRAELQSAGIAVPMLDDQALRRILDRVSVDTQIVINVTDIRKGRSRRGRKLPLVDKPIEKK